MVNTKKEKKEKEKEKAKQLIIKSNKLVEASYRLTVSEQRLTYMLISQIKKDDDDFKEYKLKVAEIVEFLGLKGQSSYSELKKITRGLISKVITIYEDDGALQSSWFASVKYHDNEGALSLYFAPRLRPYLLKLKEKFTKFEIKNVVQLKSAYSMRIYELLKQYEGIGERIIEVNELKKILKITQKSYSAYNNLKQKVLLKAQEELQEKTDITFNFEEIKKKRKVVAIRFIIRPNEPETEHLILDEYISSEEKKHFEKLKEKLKMEGISEDVALELVKKYSAEQIEKNIIYAKKKNPSNLPGYIRKAIEENYAKNRIVQGEKDPDKFKDIYMT